VCVCVCVCTGLSVGGLEISRSDFVPESDSEDDERHKADAESLGKGLVEETQAYDDDAEEVGDGGVLGNSTITMDDTPQQVVLCNPSQSSLHAECHMTISSATCSHLWLPSSGLRKFCWRCTLSICSRFLPLVALPSILLSIMLSNSSSRCTKLASV